MGKKIRIRILDEQPGSYFRKLKKPGLKNFNSFDADPGSWMKKKIGSGMEKIGIRDL
jgi:hypothetical protein